MSAKEKASEQNLFSCGWLYIYAYNFHLTALRGGGGGKVEKNGQKCLNTSSWFIVSNNVGPSTVALPGLSYFWENANKLKYLSIFPSHKQQSQQKRTCGW